MFDYRFMTYCQFDDEFGISVCTWGRGLFVPVVSPGECVRGMSDMSACAYFHGILNCEDL